MADANKNEFQRIIQKINNGLTGDYKEDIKYLQDQMEKYKGHKYELEIARACGRMIYEILPEEKKKAMNEAINKDRNGFNTAMEEINFTIYKKDFNKAAAMLKEIVDQYEKMENNKEDEVSVFHSFNEMFEEILYSELYKPKKELRPAILPYSLVYFKYGNVLVELMEYEEASEALLKAHEWNPTNAPIAFELAESYKLRGMLEEYHKMTLEVFQYAFRPNDVARCFRNLGYYYVEKQEYQLAVCCELYSLKYEKNQNVQSELYYIDQIAENVNMNPDFEMLQRLFEEKNIPLGVSKDVIMLSYYFTTKCIEAKAKESAQYYYDILSGVMNSEEVEQLGKQINSME